MTLLYCGPGGSDAPDVILVRVGSARWVWMPTRRPPWKRNLHRYGR